MQGGRHEDPVRMSAAGKRQRQASDKSLSGAVVGVLAPCQIAEPARGAMATHDRLGEVGERAAQSTAAAGRHPDETGSAAGRPRCSRRSADRMPFFCGDQAIGIAFTQPEGGKHDSLRPGDA